MTDQLTERAQVLRRQRVPFVRATVVRAEHPTSAHAGDAALVHADGTIEGFVGGSCAESSVRVHALQVLVTGDPLLLRIRPGEPATSAEEGAVTVANPCLSGGSLEIFLEPHRPPPRLVVVGDTPVARALAALGGPLGWVVESPAADADAEALADADALVVASHGRDEEPALEASLRGGVPYVALVASRARAAAVLGSLDVDDAIRARVHSPAGLDIGGRTAAEIALSILAELVAERAHARPRPAAAAPETPEPAITATDPVCGMTVAVSPASVQVERDGERVYFCGEGCRAAYLAGT
jgi:xanthine dehydrogenase accessory factor